MILLNFWIYLINTRKTMSKFCNIVDVDVSMTFLEEKMVRMQIRELEIEERLDVQERMIEILMELVNEQRDTIQLIKYAFED